MMNAKASAIQELLPISRSYGIVCERLRKGRLAPRAGFEPATNRLTAGCSTTELPGNGAEVDSERPITNGYHACKAAMGLDSRGPSLQWPTSISCAPVHRTSPGSGLECLEALTGSRRLALKRPHQPAI